MIYTRKFEELNKADVAIAGGKGASLGEMTQAGISVPPGFVILSAAFERFLEETDLNVEIDTILDSVDHTAIHTVEEASEKIRALILQATMPTDIKVEIEKGFADLDAEFVAVRSSATSEDSAAAAWAGQLDSFLNTTKATVLENVKKCWASLFTPRAIFYRFEKGLHGTDISVAVVIQKMIQSEVSGIAFSVHPVTEDHDQLIIEAGFGLGEAIVSGSITPDSFVVEKSNWNILDTNISAQDRGLFKKDDGGNEWKDIPKEQGEKQTLTNDEVIELGKLIVVIEQHYGFPVDVEWARENSQFYIVQSRPITTLAPKQEKKLTVIDGVERVLAITRNMSFWHQYLSSIGHYVNTRDFGVDAVNEHVYITIHGTETHMFLNPTNGAEYAVAILEAVNSQEKIENLKAKYHEFAERLLGALEECKTDFTLANWEQFLSDYTRMCAGLNLTAVLGRVGIEHLTEKLTAKDFSEAEIPEVIGVITYPVEHTPLFQSQFDLLKIGQDIQSDKIKGAGINEAINNWLTSYAHIPVNFCEEPWSLSDISKQLEEILHKDCSVELRRLEETHKNKVEQTQSLIKKINEEEITILAKALAEGTYLNEFRKGIFSKVSLGYRPLFKKIANMGGSENWRDCFFLTPLETTDILKGEQLSIVNLVRDRDVVGCKIQSDGTNKLLGSEELESLYEYIKLHTGKTQSLDPAMAVDTINGFSANKGIVRGVVKVILSSKDFHKLERGEILVTTMTSVDFVPVMERAGAFITNEGGITSHASIVAREMNKPCIIGTKIATQVLKDGDLVEVDADRGVVKILGSTLPNLDTYQRLFQFDGFVEFSFSYDFVRGYLDLGGLAFSNQTIWLSYIPQSAVDRAVNEGLELYKSKEKYEQYKKELYKTFKDIEKTIGDLESAHVLEKSKVDDFFSLLKAYRVLYQKTEFFYTDLAFEKKEEFPEIKENFKSFEQFKLDGRDYLNRIFLVPDSFFNRFLKKLSGEFNVSYEDLLGYSTEELLQLFKGQKVLNDIISKRQQGYLVYTTKQDIISVIGDEALKLIEKVLSAKINTKMLTGKIANKGKVTATAKVIKISLSDYGNLSKIIDEMEQGQVLVAETTEPSIIAACKKASAIVTNQGGMMSHAAIVAREMNIPCIVGVTNATEVIRDGDVVEVDAEMGTVRILGKE